MHSALRIHLCFLEHLRRFLRHCDVASSQPHRDPRSFSLLLSSFAFPSSSSVTSLEPRIYRSRVQFFFSHLPTLQNFFPSLSRALVGLPLSLGVLQPASFENRFARIRLRGPRFAPSRFCAVFSAQTSRRLAGFYLVS